MEKWEYKEVGCWYYDKEYKMRYENGVEDKDWKKGWFYINFFDKLGSEGWEMWPVRFRPAWGWGMKVTGPQCGFTSRGGCRSLGA